MDVYYNKYFKVWIEFATDFSWSDLRDKPGRTRSDPWSRIFLPRLQLWELLHHQTRHSTQNKGPHPHQQGQEGNQVTMN